MDQERESKEKEDKIDTSNFIVIGPCPRRYITDPQELADWQHARTLLPESLRLELTKMLND